MSSPYTAPVDPVTWALAYIRSTFLPSKFPDWTAGNQAKGVPSKFIQVEWVGGEPVQHIAGRERLRIQVFGPVGSTNDQSRVQVARSLDAHMWRDLRAERTSGIISLPDPADPERQITQFTTQALLHGEQEL